MFRQRDGFSTKHLQLGRGRFWGEEERGKRGEDDNGDDDDYYDDDDDDTNIDHQGSHSHLEFLMGENGSDDEFYDCPEVNTSFSVVFVFVLVLYL